MSASRERDDASLAERKRDARRLLAAARAGVSEERRRAAGVAVAASVLGLPEVRSARTVMLYSSFGTEIPLEPLASRLAVAGVRTLLPFLAGGEIAAAEHGPGGPVVPTAYGPVEPANRTPVDPVEIDVVVVPGLGFDRSGNRIGFGRGYYDRFLPKLREDAVRVVVCLPEQILDEVPHGERDQTVDVLVTPEDVIRVRPGRRREMMDAT